MESTSTYEVNNMVANGYEVTLKDTEVILKGSILTYDNREKIKATMGWTRKIKEDEQYLGCLFRCVKPISSMEDLEELQS
jgi:hypothetical protein